MDLWRTFDPDGRAYRRVLRNAMRKEQVRENRKTYFVVAFDYPGKDVSSYRVFHEPGTLAKAFDVRRIERTAALQLPRSFATAEQAG